jgi:capsular polysaccharide biosynthesis protein
MLTAEAINETEMFAVRVTSPSPQMSADIANAIADIAPAEISEIIEGSSAKVIDYAVVPTSRISPSFTVNTVVGSLIGGVLAAMFFVVCFLMDTRVKSAEDLESIYPVSVLGEIPDFAHPMQDQKKKKMKGRR